MHEWVNLLKYKTYYQKNKQTDQKSIKQYLELLRHTSTHTFTQPTNTPTYL